MNQHPLLRAYMAGIAVPTAFLLIAMTVFTIARYVYAVPLPIERVFVFPMAVVPNLWGLWNIIYVAMLLKRHVSIGLFGAALPFLLAPAGYMITRLLGLATQLHVLSLLPFVFPIGLIVYYLAWKYLVGSLNRIVGIT